MSWVKLDDGFADHPKVTELSDAAFRLHVTVLCWCARHETDGLVRAKSALAMGPARLIQELIESRLWVKLTDGYEIRDYLEYNPSHRQLELKREATRKRLQRHRGEAGNDDCNGVTSDVGSEFEVESNDGGNVVANTTPRPHLTSPLDPEGSARNGDSPDQLAKPGSGRGRRRAKRPFPADFPPAEAFFEATRKHGWPDWWVKNRHDGYGDKAQAKGWEYADWRRAFVDYLRGEIGYERGPENLAHLAPAGGSSAPDSDAEARRARAAAVEAKARGMVAS